VKQKAIAEAEKAKEEYKKLVEEPQKKNNQT